MSKILSYIANTNYVKGHITKGLDFPKYLARTLLITSVSKDVFAYGLRVHNSVRNDEIPKDKKSFVIRMDAVSGVTTGVIQIGTGLLVSNDKIQNAITKKLFKSLEGNLKAMSAAKSAFSTLSTMIIATLFAKRIIVPYVSSKVASLPIFDKKDN